MQSLPYSNIVTPAEAGVYLSNGVHYKRRHQKAFAALTWIPSYEGMTTNTES